MISVRALCVGLLSGIILGVGWFVFIDAQVNTLDSFPGTHILPPLGVTIVVIMTNLVSISKVADNTHVKVWLFIWFTIGCICVGTSIWILIREYPPPLNPYPGIGILVQTILSLFAGFIFFIGRKPFGSDNYSHDF